jgi:hypothetical protein
MNIKNKNKLKQTIFSKALELINEEKYKTAIDLLKIYKFLYDIDKTEQAKEIDYNNPEELEKLLEKLNNNKD